jgi:exodeoxyribonuclease VIII
MLERIFTSSELSAQDYHAEREHESSTNLKSILITPAHYLHKISTPHHDTDSFQIGTAVHAAVLEPEAFSMQYAIAPKFDRRTTKGKEAYEAFAREAVGKRILMTEDVAMFDKLRNTIRQNPDVHKLLALPGQSESSIFWVDEETGIKLKVRPDRLFFIEGHPVHVSVKTAASAAKHDFGYDIGKYKYHMSEAMYEDAIFQAYGTYPTTIWIVFEKDTWQVVRYLPCDATLTEGRELYRDAVRLLQKCRDANHFPGYQGIDGIEEVSVRGRTSRSKQPALRLVA